MRTMDCARGVAEVIEGFGYCGESTGVNPGEEGIAWVRHVK